MPSCLEARSAIFPPQDDCLVAADRLFDEVKAWDGDWVPVEWLREDLALEVPVIARAIGVQGERRKEVGRKNGVKRGIWCSLMALHNAITAWASRPDHTITLVGIRIWDASKFRRSGNSAVLHCYRILRPT